MSIVRLEPDARDALDELASYYQPQPTIRKGMEILRRVEGSVDAHKVMTIPVDSHCVLIGQRTIVALAGRFDAARFNELQAKWERQNAEQSAIFLVGVRWIWNTPLDPTRFEALVDAILSEESGLEWVRAAGPSFERDQGRDLIAEWVTPPGLPGGDVHYETAVRRRKVIVQVKSRKKTVGKSDVQDVRDTIERHNADGFCLSLIQDGRTTYSTIARDWHRKAFGSTCGDLVIWRSVFGLARTLRRGSPI
ncbi:restriction endonuclease [Ochrobactrum haematophilum]|uniref:Restriction endonuclease n=1 Tax=Brucella haematophila TaxID=419474 RepID=A0ABX1DPY0_9HYPH|nr:restriction endonuclease [Brucella haematophila]